MSATRNNITHTDLRPKNMLVAKDLTHRLVDFSGSAFVG